MAKTKTIQNLDLYYTAPSDKVFNNLKDKAILVWSFYDDTFGYASEKINSIKTLLNIRDNFMYMFAVFDWQNQQKVLSLVTKKTKKEIEDRLPNPYPY